ncbi:MULTISPECIES: ribonuclease E activity regulator RraA [Rhizobium]|uniref:4-hydroxy-4-methyl-2-oxoglutarate aldolase n=1 Tax=Rhizobium paranaense TaxID=1650438 RepID=A0A7W9D4G8_9HYPH|nr:ribonuclease E activity regulator RraA [Rhizobium paranaense]MBB5577353.1 regulator of ribonuclease activity A [Rhizobium paranaense]
MFNTADIYDKHHERLQVCSLQFHNFGNQVCFSGKAATLRVFEDHTPVLKAVSEAGDQRVLVVDAAGSTRVGVMGDRLAAIAVANGWAGVIIHGVIRDSAAIGSLAIGVKALGATARRSFQPTPGEFGVALSFGEVTIAPGDWIYADVDAILIAAGPLEFSSDEEKAE